MDIIFWKYVLFMIISNKNQLKTFILRNFMAVKIRPPNRNGFIIGKNFVKNY